MTETAPAYQVNVYLSLDPELTRDIQQIAASLDHLENEIGHEKLAIAARVADMESEHLPAFQTRLDYLAECSRIANASTKRKMFAESGETLRQWCDLYRTYQPFCEKASIKVSDLLDIVTFDHLRRARKIYLGGFVKSPIEALHRASVENWSADDMEFHYTNADKPSVKIGIVNWFTNFIEKRLPKLELPASDAKRVKELVSELKELLQ